MPGPSGADNFRSHVRTSLIWAYKLATGLNPKIIDMHGKVIIKTPLGEVPGIAPLVISASRSTDIPAFHADWFMHRLRQEYCAWVNPFNRDQKTYISFSNCRVIVFWSKNPEPILRYLDDISMMGKKFYFQYTINDYRKENFEPNVPELDHRIETFIKIYDKVGKDKIIWRYDPILRTRNLSLDEILDRIYRIGEKISLYTKKLVLSFADIANYSRVAYNLNKKDSSARELNKDERLYFAQKLSEMNSAWSNKLVLATCAEIEELSGITHNKCIDDALICKICPSDKEIANKYGKLPRQPSLLGNILTTPKKLKDEGQRDECGCIPSKDIGAYNTCLHLCTYCYANHTRKAVENNFEKLSKASESLCPPPRKRGTCHF